MTKYQIFYDDFPGSTGYLEINGVAQPPGNTVEISQGQLAQTSFVTGISNGDTLRIRAFDGTAWSAWSPFFMVTPLANHPPVVATGNVTASHNQTLALSSLFTVSDADGDAITGYQLFWAAPPTANSGYFVINGVKQVSGPNLDITAAQLSQTSFVTGSVTDSLQIRASDGASWSGYAAFTVTVPPNTPPTIRSSNWPTLRGSILPLSSMLSLFNVRDADGDAITRYQVWDSTRDPNSGYWTIGGVAQPAGTVIDPIFGNGFDP